MVCIGEERNWVFWGCGFIDGVFGGGSNSCDTSTFCVRSRRYHECMLVCDVCVGRSVGHLFVNCVAFEFIWRPVCGLFLVGLLRVLDWNIMWRK